MDAKRKIGSTDLVRFRLPGDLQLSPDASHVAYTVTSLHLDTNDYETTIWTAPTPATGEPRQLTRGAGAKGRPGDRLPRYSPDGTKLAFVSDRGDGGQVWLLDLVGGGEATRLTDLGGSVSAIEWSPDGRWLAIGRRPPKEERAKPGDWTATGWKPGENTDVTVVTRLMYKFNGRGFIDDRHLKIHLVEVATGKATQVTFGEFDDNLSGWSPDGKWIAFSSARRPDRELRPRTDLFAVDVSAVVGGGTTGGAGGQAGNPSGGADSRAPEAPGAPGAPQTPGEEQLPAIELSVTHPGSLIAVSWSPDGRWLAAAGSEAEMGGAYNTHLWLMPFDQAVRGTEAMAPWLDILDGFDRSLGNSVGTDVRADGGGGAPAWSGDGKWIYFTATDGGLSRLYRVSLPEGIPLDEYYPNVEVLTGDDDVPVVGSFAVKTPAGGATKTPATVALIGGGPDNPGEVYVGTLEALTVAGRNSEAMLLEPLTPVGCPVNERLIGLRRLTRLADWLSEYTLSRPERVIFPSVEGGRIEGWLMRPVNFVPGSAERHPVVLEIHGGPHSTYGVAFNHEFQLLCARGFGVFYTNPRGSKGYGFEFAERVVGDWAGIDFHDLMAASDFLARVRWADPKRMGVTGGSQGGYLTNFLIGHTTRFAAAVTQRSMSNLYTKYGVSDIGWTGDRHGMGGADLWEDEDFIMERSPIRYAPYVRTPTLIIHSEQDLRCPMEQGEQWYIALKRLGVETEFVRFAGENHELSRGGKPRNRVERLERIVGWFERFMGPAAGN